MTREAFDPYSDDDADLIAGFAPAAQTRPATHPDGFSFLLAHPHAFWQRWLGFSAREIGRLCFLIYLSRSGRLPS